MPAERHLSAAATTRAGETVAAIAVPPSNLLGHRVQDLKGGKPKGEQYRFTAVRPEMRYQLLARPCYELHIFYRWVYDSLL
jgi:hypothetical protein